MMRVRFIAMGVAGAALLAVAPQAQAANIFDDFARAFFGRPAAQNQQQVYSDPLEMTVKPRRKAPKFSETSTRPPPPVVQLDPATDPNWYLADPTLRRGDIVVTNGGVLVYQGRDSDVLRRSDFASLGSGKPAGKKSSSQPWQQQLQQAAAGGRSFFRYDAPAIATVSDPD
jgi:lipoprotein-anchoring transpeptidase ErfK/SrfK